MNQAVQLALEGPEEAAGWLDEVKSQLETADQGAFIHQDGKGIAYANSRFLKMIGKSREEILGRPVTDLFPPEDLPTLLREIKRRQIRGSNCYELCLLRAGGERLPVIIASRQIKDLDGNSFALVTVTDISAQKRAEKSLRKGIALREWRDLEIEEDLLLAAHIQQTLAPKSLASGRVGVDTYFQPLRPIGGDFGIVVLRSNRLSFLVCDVSGHGISSALLANRIYTESMDQIERGVELDGMLRRLNRVVGRSNCGHPFNCTMMAARLNLGPLSLEVAGAGHPPAMVVRPGHAPQLIESRSAILGVLEDAVPPEAIAKIPVGAGDRVVIYTDGFTDNFNARGEMLEVQGLQQIVREASELPLSAMKKEIIDRVAAWRSGPPTDDMSLVIVEVPPAS